MGNRCYVAQVDKENKKIEMFYNHWNGAWDSIEPTLDLARHLNTDFKGLAKINELAFNYGELREEPFLINEDFNIADFVKWFDPGDNGIYFINKDFELKYHYQKFGLIEDIMHDYDGILEHITKENKLNINVKDIKRHNLFENKTNIDEVIKQINSQDFNTKYFKNCIYIAMPNQNIELCLENYSLLTIYFIKSEVNKELCEINAYKKEYPNIMSVYDYIQSQKELELKHTIEQKNYVSIFGNYASSNIHAISVNIKDTSFDLNNFLMFLKQKDLEFDIKGK